MTVTLPLCSFFPFVPGSLSKRLSYMSRDYGLRKLREVPIFRWFYDGLSLSGSRQCREIDLNLHFIYKLKVPYFTEEYHLFQSVSFIIGLWKVGLAEGYRWMVFNKNIIFIRGSCLINVPSC